MSDREFVRRMKTWLKTYSCWIGNCHFQTDDRDEYTRHATGCQTEFFHYLERKRGAK